MDYLHVQADKPSRTSRQTVTYRQTNRRIQADKSWYNNYLSPTLPIICSTVYFVLFRYMGTRGAADILSTMNFSGITLNDSLKVVICGKYINLNKIIKI